MYARYKDTLNKLKDDPEKMYDYMARAAPYILEYEETKNKKDLFDRFLYEVEGEGPGNRCFFEDICNVCNSKNVSHDENTSDLICNECGVATYMLGTERGYNEEQESEHKLTYSYKRENHFNEWLNQFQAKEVSNVPYEVFDLLQNEIKKQKIQKDLITHSKVRECLKKCKLNKFYEHVPYITSILNNKKPPSMPLELEETLRNMFYKIQKPFHDNCPSERKNFLSYSYILYKFCELLSEDKYLECFPLLKSKEKLYKQDQIWKLICKDLKWEFIETSGV
jgi:hypothetical protein